MAEPTPTLDSRPHEFDERNLFLYALLGAVSLSRRLDALLAKHGLGSGAEAPSKRSPQDPLLDFVLGLVSFRRDFMTRLEAVRQATAARPQPKPTAHASAPRLRDLLR